MNTTVKGTHENLRKSVYKCGVCGEIVGGGKVSLVTHAVCWHDWQISLVIKKAVLQTQIERKTK